MRLRLPDNEAQAKSKLRTELRTRGIHLTGAPPRDAKRGQTPWPRLGTLDYVAWSFLVLHPKGSGSGSTTASLLPSRTMTLALVPTPGASSMASDLQASSLPASVHVTRNLSLGNTPVKWIPQIAENVLSAPKGRPGCRRDGDREVKGGVGGARVRVQRYAQD
jgi:hypothetical protein